LAFSQVRWRSPSRWRMALSDSLAVGVGGQSKDSTPLAASVQAALPATVPVASASRLLRAALVLCAMSRTPQPSDWASVNSESRNSLTNGTE